MNLKAYALAYERLMKEADLSQLPVFEDCFIHISGQV